MIQIVIILPILIVAYVSRPQWVESITWGALLALIPYLYMAINTFRYQGSGSEQAVLQGLYRGEAGKLTLVACGFVTVAIIGESIIWHVLFAVFIGLVLLQSVLAAHLGRKDWV